MRSQRAGQRADKQQFWVVAAVSQMRDRKAGQSPHMLGIALALVIWFIVKISGLPA